MAVSFLCARFLVVVFVCSQGRPKRGGNADDPVRLDSRRVYAQAISGVRRKLRTLPQYSHAATGICHEEYSPFIFMVHATLSTIASP